MQARRVVALVSSIVVLLLIRFSFFSSAETSSFFSSGFQRVVLDSILAGLLLLRHVLLLLIQAPEAHVSSTVSLHIVKGRECLHLDRVALSRLACSSKNFIADSKATLRRLLTL